MLIFIGLHFFGNHANRAEKRVRFTTCKEDHESPQLARREYRFRLHLESAVLSCGVCFLLMHSGHCVFSQPVRRGGKENLLAVGQQRKSAREIETARLDSAKTLTL